MSRRPKTAGAANQVCHLSVFLETEGTTDCSFSTVLFSLFFSAGVSSPSQTEEAVRVLFADPVATSCEEIRPIEDVSEPDAFSLELFGEQAQPPAAISWPQIMLNTIKSDVRSGLKENIRKNLLDQYEPKDDLAFLGPPKINKEIIPNLGATVITRDKHQIQTQAQLGASLNAVGSGMSEISKLECLHMSAEGKAAATKIAEGFRLLTDLHFRLSQARPLSSHH